MQSYAMLIHVLRYSFFSLVSSCFTCSKRFTLEMLCAGDARYKDPATHPSPRGHSPANWFGPFEHVYKSLLNLMFERSLFGTPPATFRLPFETISNILSRLLFRLPHQLTSLRQPRRTCPMFQQNVCVAASDEYCFDVFWHVLALLVISCHSHACL